MTLFKEFDLIAHVHDIEGDGCARRNIFHAKVKPGFIIGVWIIPYPYIYLNLINCTWFGSFIVADLRFPDSNFDDILILPSSISFCF